MLQRLNKTSIYQVQLLTIPFTLCAPQWHTYFQPSLNSPPTTLANVYLILSEPKSQPKTYALSFKLNMCSYPHNFVQVSPLEFLTLLSFTLPLWDQKVPCSPELRADQLPSSIWKPPLPAKLLCWDVHLMKATQAGRRASLCWAHISLVQLSLGL